MIKCYRKAFDKITGNSVYAKMMTPKDVQISAPLIYKNILIVGDFDSYTHWLDTKLVIEFLEKLQQAIVARGVTDNSAIITTAKNGKTTALEFNESEATIMRSLHAFPLITLWEDKMLQYAKSSIFNRLART